MPAAPPRSPLLKLTTNIADVPGVGVKRAGAFRRLGIRSVAHLLQHVPMRYELELAEQSIARAGQAIGPAHGAEANIAVRGEVATVRAPRSRRAPFEATLHDGTGTIRLAWFNAPWMRGKLHPGDRIIVSGKAKRHGDYIQMANPKWQAASETEAPAARSEGLAPIYPASESLPSSIIHQTVESVLDTATAQLKDHLHDEYRRKAALPPLDEAYRLVHRPASQEDIARGRRRLAFDEMFMLQLGVMLKRRHRQRELTAQPLRADQKVDQRIRARLPFTLTPAQDQVVKEIVADLQRTTPMNRLLQGDVGSGKTVVALYAMLLAVASRRQAAMMAPTELLAEQHLASIIGMMTGKGSRVRIELLTGSLKPMQRRDILKRLEAGEIDLLIGTHALLTHTVNFKNLALAVIDEQHRFGVHQRAVLRAKASDPRSTPHILVMTATPIPRTMSLTVFGDLDISTIKGVPPGRKPIITKAVGQAKSREVYQYVAKRLTTGEQAYVVVPVIDESERGLKAVRSHMDWLENGPLSGVRGKIASMHGRLRREQREQIMERFRQGSLAALVATTVIEVGVDVPNASLMVIEQADRFGLAQLHQLRGRIGRGDRRALCVLIADPITEDGKARIEAIVSTADGFAIAERDLQIRGPGELFGARQSGLPPFRVAELPRDLPLLRMARRDAHRWVEHNPHLAGARDALLRKRLLKAHGQALGLVDVA